MRYKATLRVDLAKLVDPISIGTKIGFWDAYRKLLKAENPPRIHESDTSLGPEEFADECERRVRVKFPERLRGDIAAIIVVRSISYGSLGLDLGIFTSSILSPDLNADDIMALLLHFTPIALSSSLPGDSLDEYFNVTGTVVEDNQNAGSARPSEDPTASAGGLSSRLGRAWWISNTSLVFVSVVILAAAFFMFQAAHEERQAMMSAANSEREKMAEGIIEQHKILSTAVVQERGDLKAERQAILDSLASQRKAMEQNYATTMKQQAELDKLLVDLVNQRASRAKQDGDVKKAAQD